MLSYSVVEEALKEMHMLAGQKLHSLEVIQPYNAQYGGSCNVWAIISCLLMQQYQSIELIQKSWTFPKEDQVRARLWIRHAYRKIERGETPDRLKIINL